MRLGYKGGKKYCTQGALFAPRVNTMIILLPVVGFTAEKIKMKRLTLFMGILYGFLSSLMVMAIAYLGHAFFGLPFFPFDLFDWLARHLPGALIEANIRTMVLIIPALHLGPTDTTAKLIEQIQSLWMIAGWGIIAGLILTLFVRRSSLAGMYAGLLVGIVSWLGCMAVEISLVSPLNGLIISAAWFLILFVAWGWYLSRGLESRLRPLQNAKATPPESGFDPKQEAITRRNFIYILAGGFTSLVVLVSGLISLRKIAGSAGSSLINPSVVSAHNSSPGSSSAVSVQPTSTPVPSLPQTFPYGPDTTSGPAASPSLKVLANRIAPAPGTRHEITPVDQFYRIDINALPPFINGESWRLVFKGLVQKPLSLSLADIRALPPVTQAVTLSCISNPVGGDLISTNYWTGVRLKDILNQAGLMPTAKMIAITAQDGFYEGTPLSEAMDERTLLVYAMNGAPLTPEHGYPLRIFIPNHYGMKQPKWIVQMEVIDHDTSGYWEDRGWSSTAIPQTTSVIDTVTVDQQSVHQDGALPLGGIAWAGPRGISKVEVRVDQGQWAVAELRTPAISPLTWVQWRYNWKATPGSHTVDVRATDGTGALQTSFSSDPGPEGATGIDSAQITL